MIYEEYDISAFYFGIFHQMLRIARLSTKPFPSYKDSMLKEAYEAKHHASGATSMWWKINIFLVLPALIAVYLGLLQVGAYTLPKEYAHIQHLKEHPNEWVAYPYLRKRKNEFPWGNESLFHNESNNAVPPPE